MFNQVVTWKDVTCYVKSVLRHGWVLHVPFWDMGGATIDVVMHYNVGPPR